MVLPILSWTNQPAVQVIFVHFLLEEAVKNPSEKEAQGTFFFYTNDSPRRAVSGDGYDLVYHFPHALRGQVLVSSRTVLPVDVAHIRYRTTSTMEPRTGPQ